jgi:chorismate-pyruvate lyase
LWRHGRRPAVAAPPPGRRYPARVRMETLLLVTAVFLVNLVKEYRHWV